MLRRVIMGDVAVTVVDLTQRGFLAVREAGADWILRPEPVLNSARFTAAWSWAFAQLPGWCPPVRRRPGATDHGMYAPPMAGYPGLGA